MMKPLMRKLMRPVMRGLFGEGGSPAPVMPAGAIGRWRAADYISTPRRQIPNSVASGTPTANLMMAPSGIFENAYSGSSGVVFEDNFDADGSAISCSANWFVRQSFGLDVEFPAGTYTLCVSAKRNSVSDQQFAFTSDNRVTRSSSQIAGAAMARYSYTFTKDSGWTNASVYITGIDASSTAEMVISNLELYAGAADLGPESMNGALVFGATAYSQYPVCAGGELNLSGGWGLIQLQDDAPLSAVTLLAVVSKIGLGGAGYDTFFSKAQAYAELTGVISLNEARPYSFLGGGVEYNGTGLWRLRDIGYHVLAHRCDSEGRSLWLDGIKVFSSTTGMSPTSIRDAWVGIIASNEAFIANNKVQDMALYGRALSDDDVRVASAVMAAEATVPTTKTTPLVIFQGDSISNEFPYLFGANASPLVIGMNYAASGYGIAALRAQLPQIAEIVGHAHAGQRVVVSIMIGANDLGGYVGGGAAYITEVEAHVSDIRAIARVCDLLIVGGTVTPNTSAPFNVQRAIYNALLLASPAFDAVFDPGNDPNIGQDSDALDPAKYYDGQHPTTATNEIIEAMHLRPVINGL